MNPVVSVVMSVFNGERYLRECIESILRQTFTDFEFIIINDGSTDGTAAILEAYHDPRMLVIQQGNCGLTAALNRGLALARGKYIARQDADDISAPERFEKQIAFLEANPGVGLVSSRFEFIDEEGKVTGPCYVTLDNKTLQERLIEINQFCHGAAMIRRAALTEVGLFREFFKYAQDHDLWLRLAEKYEVANLPDFLFQYRESESAISARKILIQSLFAGVAIDMALQRRIQGRDDIEQGMTPMLPPVSRLTKSLHRKLIDFYSERPLDLIKGLQPGNEFREDFLFLFQTMCAQNIQDQSELRKRGDEINSQRRSIQELQDQLARSNGHHRDEMTRKEQQLSGALEQASLLAKQLEQKDDQIRISLDQMQDRYNQIISLNEKLAFQEKQISSLTQQTEQQNEQLKGKAGEMALLSERICLLTEQLHATVHQVDSLHEHLHGAERQLHFYEEQLQQKDRQYLILEEHLKQKDDLLEKMAAIKTRLEQLKDDVQMREKALKEELNLKKEQLQHLEAARGKEKQAYEKRIEDLVNSGSWKITAPLRLIYGAVRK